ncbi:regulator of drug sensitivity 2 [Aspergillus udagawae]|uniref:Regulator of drug sensitivity 2 n=1 Tax=Aspergillus udagawae TaxID=91492 RepID=A0ABQ1B671_9EURO|nr:regulator of drug sensitivity 2 [Aspergillus udagawae]GFG07698.1 regulator of drug sensitivity 2 [Aspergillus udagawae]
MTENGAAQTGTAPDEQPRNGTMENVKLNMAEGDSSRMESGSKNTASPPVKADNSGAGTHSSPKKRRKTTLLTTVPTLLQHASTVDDREPSKRARSEHEHSTAEEEGHSNNEFSNVQSMPRNVDVQDSAGQQILADGTIALPPSSVSAVQHNNIPSSSAQTSIGPNSQQLLGYNDWLGGQSQFQDMHTFHPSYMFNAPEVTNEYNLLGDFLSSSLLDDGGIFPNDNLQGMYSDPTLINSMANLDNTALLQQVQPPQPTQSQPPQNDSVQGPSSTVVNDKARETYYMTAADPSGSDPPEERMNKLLKAKYDAGLLKPFNYVKGYARLNQYMEKNMKQSSRQKILRQLDKFRPKFRERMQSLTDIELILVEMWFERSLMEYDRVFASMAIPACCWRRTGEIFRGNKEMAELIGVPIESLRDGKLAIHEIIVEDQLVSYWEKFGAIAFDNTQKAMLTSCTLKNPNSNNPGNGIQCCFSFTIRRDNHNIPSLIIGNFLPSQRRSK